jgi:phosphoribosyl-AMP cyclohydrolase
MAVGPLGYRAIVFQAVIFDERLNIGLSAPNRVFWVFLELGGGIMADSWLDQLQWNDEGLMPVIAQDVISGRVLMQAWLNREALLAANEEGRAVYWSRSRSRLWRKGEESGHMQKLRGIYLDCDGDCLIYQVEQVGGIACHTGRVSCFYRQLQDEQWQEVDQVIKSSEEIYK